MISDFESIVSKINEIQTGLYEQNSAFNDYYDDANTEIVNGLRASEVLYRLDPISYNSALKDWQGFCFEEDFSITLKLLEENLIKNRVRHLIQALKKNKVVPFIGAGLSIPCGLKSWPSMLSDIAQRSNQIDKVKFQKLLDEGNYIEAADEISRNSSEQLSEYLKTSLYDPKPEGAVLHLPRIANECVITSNLDCILENVYCNENMPFNGGYMHGVQEHNFFEQLVSGGRCLLKLHGDCQSPSTQVFTKEQYLKAYGDENNIDFTKILPKALRQIFISNSLLFLGCSLHKDWTLKLFEAVKASGQYYIPAHYAFLMEPKDKDVMEREEELLKIGIMPIWYPYGKHEYVENFIMFLASHKEGIAPDL